LAYVVNPGGLVVGVTDEHAADLLTPPTAFRKATDEEASECADREAGVPATVELNKPGKGYK
jgi:hypothetical protein